KGKPGGGPGMGHPGQSLPLIQAAFDFLRGEVRRLVHQIVRETAECIDFGYAPPLKRRQKARGEPKGAAVMSEVGGGIVGASGGSGVRRQPFRKRFALITEQSSSPGIRSRR